MTSPQWQETRESHCLNLPRKRQRSAATLAAHLDVRSQRAHEVSLRLYAQGRQCLPEQQRAAALRRAPRLGQSEGLVPAGPRPAAERVPRGAERMACNRWLGDVVGEETPARRRRHSAAQTSPRLLQIPTILACLRPGLGDGHEGHVEGWWAKAQSLSAKHHVERNWVQSHRQSERRKAKRSRAMQTAS